MMETKLEKILVVDDEHSIRKLITINLERYHFKVYEAANGIEALEALKATQPDVVLLDVILPDMNSLQVCKRIRQSSKETIIIVLTGQSKETEKIMSLESGADEYMTKPFNPLELVSRIRAIQRRIPKPAPKEIHSIQSEPFELNIIMKKMYKDGQELELTYREFDMMKLFLLNQDKAVSRDEILNEIWGEDYFGDPKTVDVHIRKLREKIENEPSKPQYIGTVRGLGYRWNTRR